MSFSDILISKDSDNEIVKISDVDEAQEYVIVVISRGYIRKKNVYIHEDRKQAQ